MKTAGRSMPEPPEENPGTPEKSHRTQIAGSLDQTGLIVGTHDYDVRSSVHNARMRADTAARMEADRFSAAGENFGQKSGRQLHIDPTHLKTNEDSALHRFRERTEEAYE